MNIDSIPKYVLTLPEKPERRAKAEAHFTESGLGPVTFVAGINGAGFGVKTIYPYTVDDKRDRPDNPGTFFCGHHETGIFLSHYMAWTMALHSGAPYTAILEDDCKLLPNWKQRLDKALNDYPSFDWMFAGSSGGQRCQKRHVIGEVWECLYPTAFHFYIVSRRGASILIETQRKIWAPVDLSVFYPDPKGGSKTAFHRMNVVTVLPKLAEQFDTALQP